MERRILAQVGFGASNLGLPGGTPFQLVMSINNLDYCYYQPSSHIKYCRSYAHSFLND